MQTRWRVHNLLFNTCLGQNGPANGPLHTGVYTTIQSYSGTVCFTIPFHEVVRRGTVTNPTYLMVSGTVYYGNTYGDWKEYLDGSVFSVQAVSSSGTVLFDGTISSYTGSAAGNRMITFNPVVSTEIWGIKFCVSGAYPPTYVKREFIANYNIYNNEYYTEWITPSPPSSPWGWVNGPSYDTLGLPGGAVLHRESDTDPGGTFNYIHGAYIDLLPALSGSGVLYYIESCQGPNLDIRDGGWAWWNGPPPPTGYGPVENYIMALGAAGGSDNIYIGLRYLWSAGYYADYLYSLSNSYDTFKHVDVISPYARVFFVRSGELGTTEFQLFSNPGSDFSNGYTKSNVEALVGEFGLADSGTKFRFDIETVDLYNYCSP